MLMLMLGEGDIRIERTEQEVRQSWEEQDEYERPIKGIRCSWCKSQVYKAAATQIAPFYCINCTHRDEKGVEAI